jgi:protein-S-isoprenylcysteine O-methyltransferase Ste14
MADVSRGLVRTVARRRVALGFVSAAVMFILARPTWESWGAGLLVAALGECVRLWAAGHLEKGREVTRSGPYRFFGHPLYAGSMVIAIGVAIAARGALPALLAGLYMGVTIAAAIQVEEAQLREAFGTTYDDYQASRAAPMDRRFSFSRAMRNREHRAVAGLVLGFALLALKIITASE